MLSVCDKKGKAAPTSQKIQLGTTMEVEGFGRKMQLFLGNKLIGKREIIDSQVPTMCGIISPEGNFLLHWLGQLSFWSFSWAVGGYCSTTCGTVAIQVVTVFNKPSWEIRLGHTMSHTVVHIWNHLSKLIRQRKGWHWRGTSPPMPGGMFVNRDAHITLNYPFSKNLAHAKKRWPQKTETLWILWALVEANDWWKFPCTDVKQYQPQQKRFETNKGKHLFHHHLAKPLHFAVLIVDSYKSGIKWLNKGDIQCVMTWYINFTRLAFEKTHPTDSNCQPGKSLRGNSGWVTSWCHIPRCTLGILSWQVHWLAPRKALVNKLA